MPTDSYNTVYINRAALQQNFKALQAKAGKAVRLLPMIKSDAYGHGIVETAQALAEVGAGFFGVAEVEEGVKLREAGLQGEILIFLGSSWYAELIDYRLTPVVFDIENIRALSAYAQKRKTAVGVHLKVDTGMGRFGVMPHEVSFFVEEIGRLSGVYLAGLLSHFPMADQIDLPSTKEQNLLFIEARISLALQESTKGKNICHIANSAALINFPETYHEMVRPGISLYGCYPSDDKLVRERVTLQPVMSFATKILQIKQVPAGYGVSYGHTFKTSRPSRLAVLPVGYADGYLRSLTGKAEVLIRGKRAPVCGRICMNATVVDVTDCEAEVSDDVILMGEQTWGDRTAEITADEIAGWMGTINYEVLCLFGNSNQRVYC